mmetsp:Transcript_4511/g.14560  ORF Transcript_4511/g.14560 Transcript_4511/m.14560 type:complete len:274 (+) Transcript_4511:581-1402(+)
MHCAGRRDGRICRAGGANDGGPAVRKRHWDVLSRAELGCSVAVATGGIPVRQWGATVSRGGDLLLQLHLEPLATNLESVHGLDRCLRAVGVPKTYKPEATRSAGAPVDHNPCGKDLSKRRKIVEQVNVGHVVGDVEDEQVAAGGSLAVGANGRPGSPHGVTEAIGDPRRNGPGRHPMEGHAGQLLRVRVHVGGLDRQQRVGGQPGRHACDLAGGQHLGQCNKVDPRRSGQRQARYTAQRRDAGGERRACNRRCMTRVLGGRICRHEARHAGRE